MTRPQLQRYDDFARILPNYHISDAGKELLKDIKLTLLVSVTSAGRNAIITELVKTGAYEQIVSHTTRPMRSNNGVMEQDGVEYFFRSEDEFMADLEEGEFLEAEIIHEQQVSGIHLRELRVANDHGKIAVNEVEILGAANIHSVKPDTNVIFVLPPNYQEWMRRLTNRGEMSQDEYLNRLRSAETEIEAAINSDFYSLVINDELDDAVAAVRRIVEDGEQSPHDKQEAIDLAWHLLNEIKSQLHS